MATKADFSTQQWEAIAFAVTDTMMFVTMANGAHFWESISETTASARYLIEQAKTSTSTLVRDIATDAGHHRDKIVNADDLETITLDRVAYALNVVTEVAPDETESFKALIIGVADAAAEAKNGIDAAEETAIDKLKSALL